MRPPMEHDSANELNVRNGPSPSGRLVTHRKDVLAIGKAAGALLYDCERLGQNLLEAVCQRT